MAPSDHKQSDPKDIRPRCPIFGECGGCQYQDIPYEEELRLKESRLRELFRSQLGAVFDETCFYPIVPSPLQYHYRSRIDINLLRVKSGETFLGFAPAQGFKVLPIESCPIAVEAISDFIPELKKQAAAKLPAGYRIASLVVRTGEEGRVFWGGIGRGSLRMPVENYFSTTVAGKKIFYRLDTFFQANLSILPELFKRISALNIFDNETVFYDLYGGVGLFGIGFADAVKKVVLIEENKNATKVALYNAAYNKLENLEIITGRLEDHLSNFENPDFQLDKGFRATSHPPTGRDLAKKILADERPSPATLIRRLVRRISRERKRPNVVREWLNVVKPSQRSAGPRATNNVAMIDPPRAGLNEEVAETLAQTRHFQNILYLSCNPEALVRDLKIFTAAGWRLAQVIPFDFFPRTRHLETLVHLVKHEV